MLGLFQPKWLHDSIIWNFFYKVIFQSRTAPDMQFTNMVLSHLPKKRVPNSLHGCEIRMYVSISSHAEVSCYDPIVAGSQQCICWLSPEWHLGHSSHEHDRMSGMTQKLSSLLGWVQQEHTISIWCLQRWNKTMHCIASWKWTFLRELAVSCGLQKDAKYFILYNSIHTYIAIYLHNNRENHKNKKSFNVCFLDVLLLSVIYYCTNTECIWGTTASKGLDWWIETLFSFQALGIFVRILRPSILLH